LSALALEYAINKVQANKERLKFNLKYQLLFYDDKANLLGESTNTVKETRKLYQPL
jgi:hypothetical protein